MSLFHDADREKMASRLKLAKDISRARHFNKAGEIIFVDMWISSHKYRDKKVLLVTTSDITQRLEAERQLIQAGKLTTLGEMATGVAHELNQPLSVIKTASSFCLKKVNNHQPLEAETLNTMLKKIDSNVDRATKIITHMRQFARKTDLTRVKVQLNHVLERAFEIFSQQLRLRSIEVVWDTDKQLPLVLADADRMEQVFINLLINARDAIEEKWGPKDRMDGGKTIVLKTWSEEKTVFAEICDTGSGISESVANKIFEPFYTTKEVGKGTGLGLSISYGIVKDCGGTIEIKSSSPEGTCFLLSFSAADDENGNHVT